MLQKKRALEDRAEFHAYGLDERQKGIAFGVVLPTGADFDCAGLACGESQINECFVRELYEVLCVPACLMRKMFAYHCSVSVAHGLLTCACF